MNVENGTPAADLPVTSGWVKSHYSTPSGNCVEVATLEPGLVALRNSRDPEGPALVCPPDAIDAFVRGATEGQFAQFTR